MAVLPTHSDFRERFALRIANTQSVNIADGADNQIIRLATDWDTLGIEVGMRAVISGSASNDAILLTVVSFDDETLVVDTDLTSESAVTVTITFWREDPDGQPEYPGATSSTNLVRANSFDGGLTGSTTTFEGVPVTITANSEAADGTPGSDEYDWYLSQRTDEGASQYFALAQKPDEAGDTFSGTVILSHTALATSVFGVAANTITVEAFFRLLTNVHLYCRRQSDGAIQWAPLLETMMPS
jgi:hypothetical protein